MEKFYEIKEPIILKLKYRKYFFINRGIANIFYLYNYIFNTNLKKDRSLIFLINGLWYDAMIVIKFFVSMASNFFSIKW